MTRTRNDSHAFVFIESCFFQGSEVTSLSKTNNIKHLALLKIFNQLPVTLKSATEGFGEHQILKLRQIETH